MNPQPEKEIAWRKFPQMEALFQAEEMPRTMRRIEQTCRQLDDIIKNGSEDEQRRAKAAMNAYGRTLELIRRLDEEMAKQSEAAG